MQERSAIYLDNAATTPLDPEVLELMAEAYRSLFGNPSSIHAHGRRAKAALEKARQKIATILGASPGEIYFTSGGTEANNTALLGAVRDLGVSRIITSPFEHPSVLQMLRYLQQSNPSVSVLFVETDALGMPSFEHLEQLLSEKCPGQTLVSLMHANNETGTITDIKKAGALCASHNALFHTDTVQTMGYFPINVASSSIHFLSASAHKFYGPKGIGFLYMNNQAIIKPMIYGGGQERGIRSSTENVAAVIGMARALELMEQEREKNKTYISRLRAYLIQILHHNLPGCKVLHETTDQCHYKIVNLALPATPKAEFAVMNLDIAGVSVSGGSACSSGVEKNSEVMEVLHRTDKRKHIRVSFSHHNSFEEIDTFVDKLTMVL